MDTIPIGQLKVSESLADVVQQHQKVRNRNEKNEENKNREEEGGDTTQILHVFQGFHPPISPNLLNPPLSDTL